MRWQPDQSSQRIVFLFPETYFSPCRCGMFMGVAAIWCPALHAGRGMLAESFALITVITVLGNLLSESQEWVPRAILMLLGATLWP